MKATKHSNQCTMAFGRYTKEVGVCARCEELKSGGKPRDGWQKQYYATKKKHEEQFNRELKAHNCTASKCGPVCTFGDW
jgi:hypothetical protein